jgi:predicted O-linked N-acetylglucosamine transferase (SPINDLY family)
MSKVQPNAPCPCGSGNKFKKCCSGKQPLAASEPTAAEIGQLADLFNQRRYSAAETIARKITERFQQFGFGWKVLGVVLKLQGRTSESLIPAQKAAILLPMDAESHSNLSVTLQELDRLEEAEASCRRALAIKPDYAEAHYNLGNTLKEMSRLAEAEAGYRRAIEIKPNHAEAHYNLGNILKELGLLAEAELSYRSALMVKPDYAEAHGNLGVTLRNLGRLEEAEASYRQALKIKPDIAGVHSNLLFSMNYSASHFLPHHLEEACAWETECTPESAREAARKRQFSRTPLAGRRLRVGYVSGDFRQHAISYFVEQLFAHHDATRVEVFAYSANSMRDAATERIEALAQHWVPAVGLSDQKLFAHIEEDQIDVLVDLSGHTAHNRLGLFAHRAAPVQAHWLGYFATTGLTEMDYWVGDPILTPAATEHQFIETVWRLPRVWVSYEGKDEAPNSCWQPAPDGALCLGSFNNLGKLTPATLALWAQVLLKLPEARLLLKTKELTEENNRQRILDAFASYGIEPGRIELQDGYLTPDWVAHMACYDRMDIALDPVGGVGGGTTTCDALWMGVPVVCLLGDRMASRMTASMLDAVGRSEWLAASEDDYVAKVAALAHDIEGRKMMRASQRARMASSPLCDAKGLAQALEDAFEAMFELWWARTKKPI